MVVPCNIPIISNTLCIPYRLVIPVININWQTTTTYIAASDVQAHNLEKQKHLEEYYKHTVQTSTTPTTAAATEGGEAEAGANQAESGDENATEVTAARTEESGVPWPTPWDTTRITRSPTRNLQWISNQLKVKVSVHIIRFVVVISYVNII